MKIMTNNQHNSIATPNMIQRTISVKDKAKQTFTSLPKEIQVWWAKLDSKLKDPSKFDNWLYLSADQWAAVYEIYNGRYKRITLCGQAGSGKSYVSKFAQKLLEESNKDVLMVASTGIAAYLSGGATINSAFSMGADSDILPMGLTDKIHHSVKPQRKGSGKVEFQVQMRKSIESIVCKVQSNGLINKDSKKELIIFFDEIGMFSSENLVIAIQIIQQHFAYTKRPVRFVFLADYRQLLPINKPSETPWEMYSSLAIHEAKFETMIFTSDEQGVKYSKELHKFPSQLGVVKNEDGISINGGIALSLITNHRQGENELFINNLNSVGDGTGSFTVGNASFVSSIAERIYLIEGSEIYNWMAAKAKENVLANNEELAKGVHVYFSNRAVSERNTIGTAQAISTLKAKYGENYKLHTRDYGVTITVAKGETNDPINRVLQDISPVGITTLSTKDPSYQHEKATHVNVASMLNKDIHTFAYQRICVGMRWMCRMNLSTKLRNGTVCTVTYVSDKYFNVVVDNDITKEHIRVEAQTELFVKKNGKGQPIAKVYGVPGHPAYALTYHKTQGITVPKGNIFVLHIDSAMVNFANQGNMHGLLYVGLSRVESLENLYIVYEANLPVEQGMNTMCKTNRSVFDFIKYTEFSMQQYLKGEYTHTFNSLIKEEVKQTQLVKQEDYDLFSSELPTTSPEIKRMKMF